MTKRKYLVADRQEVPRQSHRSFLFPECLYTLKRQDDGCMFRVTLSKSLNWEPGDIIELEDFQVEQNHLSRT
ncbi:MAG TPA: hypothetical protein VKU80_19080 [Planctomycetota bacterium]|nr:hypothetical protein [Planctomycetota bacterium]